MSKLYKVLSTLKEKINTFYLLAFILLLLFLAYHIEWLFSAIIPIYGFILLFIKKQKLLSYGSAKLVQKIIGLSVMVGSFFAYYGLVLFLPSASFYTAANYVIFLFGLSLLFFEVSALKETVSSIFLIVAGTASDFISEGLGPYLSPYVTPQFAYLITGIMNALGVKSTIQSTGTYPIISFPTIQGGTITAWVNWSCVGVSSALIFSIILIVLLIEEHNNLKTRMIWSIIGISGIWILNVLRVVVILLADYFYGAEVGGMIHYVIGYTIFITWLTMFLYLLSKKTGHASL